MTANRPLSCPRWSVLLALLVVAVAGASRPSQAQEAGDVEANRALALMQKWNQDQHTFPVYVEARAFATQAGPSLLSQVLPMMAAELGLYDSAIDAWPLGPGTTRSTPAALPSSDARATDAVEAIARLAQERRVVVVNEAHHAAQTRAIFLDLLPRLREQGFDWYCVETLDGGGTAQLQGRGYPVRNSGVYSREPIFGEALRRAIALGYSPCAYESATSDTQQARETGQAENLARVLRDHPGARILVHAGYGHARKDVTVRDASPMAAELQRLAGIEPLTVDQTTLAAIAPRKRENPAYRPLLARLPGAARASVFVDGAGKPWTLEPSAYDVSVVLPDPAPRAGRAGWLWAIPGKVAVERFDADCAGKYPCAIEARHAGESDDAVPADVVVREEPDAAVPALALFPGEYRLSFVASDGRLLRETALTVAAADAKEHADGP